jgi:iron complex transport system permease protein
VISVVRSRRISFRVPTRLVAVCLALAAATVPVVIASLCLGRFWVPADEVLSALLGRADGMAATVVVEWRLPRVLAALGFGAALGAAGAVFQSLTRNPLGSPDVIGFTTGAHTGAMIAIVFLGGAFGVTSVSAVLGGALTAAAVFLIARGTSGAGAGIVVVGIAITAVLSSVNVWLLLTADLRAALSAAFWGMGSLNGLQWERVAPALLLLLPPLVLVVLLWRRAELLEMGEDAAGALGVRPGPTRLALIACGVLLAAVVTAVAGPVAFIALVAPQVARRTARTSSVEPVTAAATGALLLAASDLAAQHAFGGALILPVGVVTAGLGGCYLLCAIVLAARREERA